MSIKKEKYGNTEDVTIIEFGNGTLEIVNGENCEYKSLLIKSNNKIKEIGEEISYYDNSDVFKPEIALVFHNKESFNIFKEYFNLLHCMYYQNYMYF